MSENLDLTFYQHLYNETLFIVPKSDVVSGPVKKSMKQEIDPEIANITGDTLPVQKYRLLGDNHKGLIIVVSLPEQDFLNLPKNQFLVKVLAAIQHAPTDVAFLNLPKGEKLDIYNLSKATLVKSLVVFGNGLLDKDAHVGIYKPAAIGDIPLLLADPVEAIELDVNRKKQLWSGLQAIFLK